MGCAGVLTDALAGAGVKNLSKIPPNKGRGHVIVAGDVADGELGKLAAAVNQALTPHRDQVKPSVSLELFVKLDKALAAAAFKALAAVDGVDAKSSRADLQRGVLAVRLAGGKSVSVAGITSALRQAGLSASVATATAAAQAKPPKKE